MCNVHVYEVVKCLAWICPVSGEDKESYVIASFTSPHCCTYLVESYMPGNSWFTATWWQGIFGSQLYGGRE